MTLKYMASKKNITNKQYQVLKKYETVTIIVFLTLKIERDTSKR